MLYLILLLLSLQVTTAIASSPRCPSYDRKDWQHWIDEDRDCQNARHEVLIAESTSPVVFKTEKGCRVVSGNWNDSYSDKVITDATKLDIDHLVPLKEAHESGGHAWDAYRKRDYANDLSDPNTLIAVDRGLNRQKGAGDPAEWLPPNKAYQIEYAQAWVAVKLKWGLTSDPKEIAVLRSLMGAEAEMPIVAEECSGSINPFSAKLPVARVDCSAKKYCKDMSICDEAKAYLIQCGMKNLDRDGDGVPCEALCD
ncbi:MAG: excalibur calcium-binding domain-containing protein [SAR324 cluster bacterium]|nr:excalibur calcium-binding domain-containing protein [SAR324 cluster bacterium]